MMNDFQMKKENQSLKYALETICKLLEEKKPKNISLIGQNLAEPMKSQLKKISTLIVNQIDELGIRNHKAGITNAFFRQTINQIKSEQQLDEEQLDEEYQAVSEDNRKLIKQLWLTFRALQEQKIEINNRIISFESSLREKQIDILELYRRLESQQQLLLKAQKERNQLLRQKKFLKDELQRSSVLSISREQEQQMQLRSFMDSYAQSKQQGEKKTRQMQSLRDRIRELEEELKNIKKKPNGINNLSKSYSLLNYSSAIISNVSIHLPDLLNRTLETAMNTKIVSSEVLYSFAEHKRINFHQRIDKRENTLLFCSITEDKFIGGFSTAGFSLRDEPEGSIAFLFSIDKGEISVRHLKHGKCSTSYDCDFLVFGNDEISVEKGKSELTSYIPVASESELHYHSGRNDLFSQMNKQIELKNYQICTVTFS